MPAPIARGLARRLLAAAERVGFEPTDHLRGHLLSREARSTGLRHLSSGRDGIGSTAGRFRELPTTPTTAFRRVGNPRRDRLRTLRDHVPDSGGPIHVHHPFTSRRDRHRGRCRCRRSRRGVVLRRHGRPRERRARGRALRRLRDRRRRRRRCRRRRRQRPRLRLRHRRRPDDALLRHHGHWHGSDLRSRRGRHGPHPSRCGGKTARSSPPWRSRSRATPPTASPRARRASSRSSARPASPRASWPTSWPTRRATT